MPRSTTKQPSIFAGLTADDLRDDRRLYAWFVRACGSLNPPVNHLEADLRFVFETAERSLRVATNPPAMFATLVGKRKNFANCKDEDSARRRIKRLRQQVSNLPD